MTIQSLYFDLGLGHSNIRTVVYGLHIPYITNNKQCYIIVTNKQKKLFHYVSLRT